MIRFFLNTQRREADSFWQEHTTVDIEVPQLQALLESGGFGETGHEITTLIGAQIIPNQDQQ